MSAIRRITGMVGDADWTGHTFDQEFAAFCRYCPEWVNFDDQVSAFFNNPAYETHTNLKLIRHQSIRICGAHAAVVFLHYLQDVRSTETNPNVGCVDIVRHVRSTWDGDKLLSYLDGSTQIEPLRLFGSLTRIPPGRLISFTFSQPFEEAFHANMELCALIKQRTALEPGLVTGFHVTKLFLLRNGPVSYQIPEPIAGFEPVHAMLLIGTRVDTDGRYFFLLQNWHYKQFIEVSAEYFASCRGTVHFCPAGPVIVANTVPILHDVAAIETEMEGEEEFDDSDDVDFDDDEVE